jgi:hypothetical protein
VVAMGASGPNGKMTQEMPGLPRPAGTAAGPDELPSCGDAGSSPAARRLNDPMLGRTFGRLVVIARSGDSTPRPMYRCLCLCGRHTDVRGDQLRSGRTQSCGCWQRRQAEAAQYRRWARVKAARRSEPASAAN